MGDRRGVCTLAPSSCCSTLDSPPRFHCIAGCIEARGGRFCHAYRRLIDSTFFPRACLCPHLFSFRRTTSSSKLSGACHWGTSSIDDEALERELCGRCSAVRTHEARYNKNKNRRTVTQKEPALGYGRERGGAQGRGCGAHGEGLTSRWFTVVARIM